MHAALNHPGNVPMRGVPCSMWIPRGYVPALPADVVVKQTRVLRNCSLTKFAHCVKLVVVASQASCIHVFVESDAADKLC